MYSAASVLVFFALNFGVVHAVPRDVGFGFPNFPFLWPELPSIQCSTPGVLSQGAPLATSWAVLTTTCTRARAVYKTITITPSPVRKTRTITVTGSATTTATRRVGAEPPSASTSSKVVTMSNHFLITPSSDGTITSTTTTTSVVLAVSTSSVPAPAGFRNAKGTIRDPVVLSKKDMVEDEDNGNEGMPSTNATALALMNGFGYDTTTKTFSFPTPRIRVNPATSSSSDTSDGSDDEDENNTPDAANTTSSMSSISRILTPVRYTMSPKPVTSTLGGNPNSISDGSVQLPPTNSLTATPLLGQPAPTSPSASVRCDLIFFENPCTTITTTSTRTKLVRAQTSIVTTIVTVPARSRRDVTSTPTITSTKTQVYTVYTSTTTVYAACQTDNLISKVNGQYIGNFGDQTDSFTVPASNATDCCIKAVTGSNINLFGYHPDGTCELYPNTGGCQSNPAGFIQASKKTTAANGIIAGNGYCGGILHAVADK